MMAGLQPAIGESVGVPVKHRTTTRMRRRVVFEPSKLSATKVAGEEPTSAVTGSSVACSSLPHLPAAALFES
jgi:transposase